MKQDYAIQVHNVSKVFKLEIQSYNLRQDFSRIVSNLILRNKERNESDTVRQKIALDNVSFNIMKGESVAIVGANGAGKTTLMRIITNIMRPTSGYVALHGRFVSLIGVGTGFITDLSGRRNIYINAAIHGVAPRDVDKILEEIIEFADIGEYIDVPIKDYSSGMRSRLGFSIAVHILPDIVLLDEVLSVGDAEFKMKSGQRLRELLQEERTVVMISHSSSQIRRICSRAIWLHKGVLKMDGEVNEVLDQYDKFMKRRKRRKKVRKQLADQSVLE